MEAFCKRLGLRKADPGAGQLWNTEEQKLESRYHKRRKEVGYAGC